MNKSNKIFSLLLVLISFMACDVADEVEMPRGELIAKYTFVKETPAGKVVFLNTSENADSYFWDFGDGTTSTVKNPIKIYTATGDYLVTLTAKYSKTGETKTYSSTVSLFIFAGGLITNGDFESGVSPWRLGVINPLPSGLLLTESGNTYFSINVGAAGNPFDVNLSQLGLNLTLGTTYKLTFDAWSSVNRNMIVGIGLSSDPWTNQTVTANLTTVKQSYSFNIVANFTNPNARVIFDMGAAVGRVNIDNVTLNALP